MLPVNAHRVEVATSHQTNCSPNTNTAHAILRIACIACAHISKVTTMHVQRLKEDHPNKRHNIMPILHVFRAHALSLHACVVSYTLIIASGACDLLADMHLRCGVCVLMCRVHNTAGKYGHALCVVGRNDGSEQRHVLLLLLLLCDRLQMPQRNMLSRLQHNVSS